MSRSLISYDEAKKIFIMSGPFYLSTDGDASVAIMELVIKAVGQQLIPL